RSGSSSSRRSGTSRTSTGTSSAERSSGGGTSEVGEDPVERVLGIPGRVVVAKAREVADVADVVAAPRLLDVLPGELPAAQIVELRDRLEHRDAVRAAAAEVVDRGRTGAVGEGGDRRADVERVEVVAHLLGLVAVDLVGDPFLHRAGEVG